ncbi:MAG TPA: hypothetical protein VMU53_11640 [Candidatus Sulfotelmatobacter sp.]|nr:hypothetical protein [Candidatus Sulfotelmatobacter sp.]
MHPLLYRENKQPVAVKVDLPDGVPGEGWTKLEENVMGEFGWKEVLKQFLDEERAKKVMTGWDGDDYATYEQKDNKQNLMLFTRLHFDSAELASGFFAAYRDALKRKYPERTIRVDTPDAWEFKSSSSVNVFFRCEASDCITLEGGDAPLWEKWIKKLNWPATAAPIPANTANSGPIRMRSVFARAS